MAAKSKAKRREAKLAHARQKRRAKYKRIFEKYRDSFHRNVSEIEEKTAMETFSSLLEELHGLNTKTHQQLLSDLKASGAIHPWYGDWYRMLVSSIETTILEKELLK